MKKTTNADDDADDDESDGVRALCQTLWSYLQQRHSIGTRQGGQGPLPWQRWPGCGCTRYQRALQHPLRREHPGNSPLEGM